MGAERRLLTVLFADLVGSTELGSSTDPELLREEMTRYFERMRGIAETHGGTVEKFIGDAIMVAFGVPKIHDDDAERAVRCGLAMQAAMAPLNRELDLTLSLRVGVNTGEAVIRSGDDGQFIVGDSVNVAARLQQSAHPGEVIIGRLTAQLVAGAIEVVSQPPINVKGKSAPLESFAAVAARTATPGRIGRIPGSPGPFIGRRAELSQIAEHYAAVSRGRRPAVLLLSGAAGVGKSRLKREALAEIGLAGEATLLEGRCLPYGGGITYWPVIEMLRTDAGINEEDDRRAALRKLDERLEQEEVGGHQRPAVSRRLSVVLGLASAEEAMPEVSGENVNAELAWAVAQYLSRLARDKPLVLVIDDLQWAEPAMIDLIAYATRQLAAVPILWLCIARPEFLEAHSSWPERVANSAVITLDPLTSTETSSLLANLLDVANAPVELYERLVERSGGNPLFCEEFLRMLIDDQVLVAEGTRWRATRSIDDIRVPESIQAVLTSRLDLVPDSERLALQAASVIGERFTSDQVAALRPEIDVAGALVGLQQRGLTLEEPDNSLSYGSMRFKHLLIRDVAYSTLSKTERGALHDRFSRYLETVSGDRQSEFVDIIGHHAMQAFALATEMKLAGEVTKPRAARALSWALRRGEHARSLNNWSSLDNHLTAAKKMLAALDRELGDRERLRLDMLEAERLAAVSAPDAAVDLAGRVVRAAEERGQWAIAAGAQLLIARIALRQMTDPAAVDVEISKAARLFRLAEDPVGELETEWLQVFGQEMLDKPHQGVPHLWRLAQRAAAVGDHPRAGAWMAMTAYMAAETGYPAVRAIVSEAIREVELAGSRWPAELITATATLEAFSGNVEAAVKRLRDAIASSSLEAWAIILMQRSLACLLLTAGRPLEAVGVLEDGIKRSEAYNDNWHRCGLLSRRSLAAVRLGDVTVGEDYLRRALAAAMPGDDNSLGETRLALAELRAAQGRDDEVEPVYNEIVLPEMPGAPLQYDVDVSLVRFLISRGRGPEALDHLDRMEAGLRPLEYRYCLDQIAALRCETQTANRTGRQSY